MTEKRDAADGPPSAWVARWLPPAATGAAALDVATGGGRHARLALARGYRVTAVDRSLDRFVGAGAQTLVRDLETGAPFAAPPLDGSFEAVIVTNYLHRPLFPALAAALAPGGRLIWETFMVGQERYGRPTNPDFLLAPGELLRFAAFGLVIAGYEAGLADGAAMRQRVCAIRSAGAPVALPPSPS